MAHEVARGVHPKLDSPLFILRQPPRAISQPVLPSTACEELLGQNPWKNHVQYFSSLQVWILVKFLPKIKFLALIRSYNSWGITLQIPF